MNKKDFFEIVEKNNKLDPNSLIKWFPKVMNDVRVPKTEIVKVDILENVKGIPARWNTEDVKKAVEKVGGYPVFIRTDLASNKHYMSEGSKVSSEKELDDHIANIIEFNEMVSIFGLDYKFLVIREWLDLSQKNSFKAFKGTTIGRELRFFIKDNEPICCHYYWPKDAIKFFENKKEDTSDDFIEDNDEVEEINAESLEESVKKHKESFKNGPENWEQKWEMLKNNSFNNMKKVLVDVNIVADNFDGYWSVDFAQDVNGDWYLIDMALGNESWHPECEKREEL